MRAIVFSEQGAAEVLTLTEVPESQPGRGQVRIRVVYASVNYMRYHYVSCHQPQGSG